MDKCSVKAKLINKNDVLNNPERYRDRSIVVLEVYNRFMDVMLWYYKHNVKQDDGDKVQRVTFANWEDTWSDEAKNFMFAMRDKLAKAQGDSSREHKDHLYESAKEVCGLTDKGKTKHLADLNAEELLSLINQFLDWLQEAEEPLADVMVEYRDLMGRIHDGKRAD